MEDSGYVINNYPGLIGLYTGSAFNLQWPLRNIVKNGEDARLDVNQFDDKDFTSTRISYRLNLKGPSMSIQTACSSGLTVLHTACRALVTGECDIALAATSSIKLPIKGGHLYQKGGLYSQDNYLRPFDENATGIVEGDGIGVLVLKALDAAMKIEIIYMLLSKEPQLIMTVIER
jgi:acyl transferase domain-containing protein